MATNPINPFSNPINPFKALQSGNKAMVAKYLAAKDMAQYQRLQYQRTDAEIGLTSLSTLQSNLSIMNEAVDRLKKSLSGLRSVLSSDSSYITATTTSYTSAGNYNIQIGSIAQSQRIASAIFAGQDSEVADLSTYTTQRLRIQVGSGSPTDLTIDSSNNTLQGIKEAINNANAGIQAEISKFDVTNSNNTIKFKLGSSTYTASIAEGNYTGEQLAQAVKLALINAYNQGGDKFNVSYDADNNRFTITNSTGSEMELAWDDPDSTARQMLGFDTTAVTIQNNASTTAQNSAEISGYRLVLTSNSTGADNKITVKVDVNNNGDFGDMPEETANAGLGRLAFDATYDSSNNVIGGVTNMSQTQSAQNALIKFNGIEYTRTINNISDIIPGLTLNLKKADSGYSTDPKTFRLSVYPMGIEANLKSFVSSFNITADVIEKQKGTIDEPGALKDEPMLNQLESSLRDFFNANSTSLTDLGLSFTVKGRLQLDEIRLKSRISEDASSVSRAMGILSTRLSLKLSGFIETDIPRQQATYEDSIKDIQRQELKVKAQLKIKQMMIVGADNPLNELLNQPVNKEGGLLGLLSSSAKKIK